MTEAPDRPPSAETLVVSRQRPVRLAATSTDIERFVLGLYDSHHADLLGFARALARDAEAGEDLVGDAFVRLIRECREGREPGDARGWLFRVVANLAVSRGRRLRTARRFLGRLVERRVEESPEARLADSEIRPDLLDGLAALPRDGRTALVMAAHGFSGREIAAAIGKSENATRTVLYRARMRLRDRLEEEVDR
jgi:RNA polymerase sigma-70 factor (ECF subfamily)